MILDIIITVSTDLWNEKVRVEAEKVKSQETQLRVTELKKGPVTIESEYDEIFASPCVVSLAEELELNGSNGIILYCFG
ncbi:MAG: hypothetical protein L5655_00425 [Thermosediminibacteraceae bacterium]|nr:hypothetical protein [Thermosediminibacteraceae bacterium]